MVEEVQLGMTAGSPKTCMAEDFEEIRGRKKRHGSGEASGGDQKTLLSLFLTCYYRTGLVARVSAPGRAKGKESAGMELSCYGI